MLKSRGFWLGVGVTGLLLGWFLYGQRDNFGEIRDALREANYLIALASLPVYFVGLWLRTIRWQYLLRPVKQVSVRRLYPVVIIGLMANNLIPARAGEFARAYVLGQRERVSKTATLGTIAVDRLFDGLTLIPMLLIVAAFAGGDAEFSVLVGPNLNFAQLGIAMAVIFGVALALLFYLAMSTNGQQWLHTIVHRFAPARVKPQVEYLLTSFFDGLRALRNPLDLGIAFVMSVASWTLEATMYYIIAIAFDIREPFHVFLLLTAAANLAIAIVASQGGIGAFELVVSKTVVAFGVSSELGSAYAIGLHAILLFPIIALGLYLLWSMKLTFGDMLKKSQHDDEPPPMHAHDSAGRLVVAPSGASPGRAIEGGARK